MGLGARARGLRTTAQMARLTSSEQMREVSETLREATLRPLHLPGVEQTPGQGGGAIPREDPFEVARTAKARTACLSHTTATGTANAFLVPDTKNNDPLLLRGGD